jgi:hypothetical protein
MVLAALRARDSRAACLEREGVFIVTLRWQSGSSPCTSYGLWIGKGRPWGTLRLGLSGPFAIGYRILGLQTWLPLVSRFLIGVFQVDFQKQYRSGRRFYSPFSRFSADPTV